MAAVVEAVSRDDAHRFSKTSVEGVRLLAGLGIEGDAHAGATVQHRSRVRRDPTQPNLRQVHLVHAELFDDLQRQGFSVGAGDLGENVLTRGLDLLGLPRGSLLRLGPEAVVEVTGLRNPCVQIQGFRDGLLRAVTPRGPDGTPRRLAGVMSVVVAGGWVRPGDEVAVELPVGPHEVLEPV